MLQSRFGSAESMRSFGCREAEEDALNKPLRGCSGGWLKVEQRCLKDRSGAGFNFTQSITFECDE